MADILMSGLKAIASEIATTEGFEGVVRVIDAPLPVDDPVFKLINKDDGPSLFTRITTWLSDRWNELPPAGWLWCFPPIAIGYKMIAGVVRLFGDAIEPYYSFNWNITDEEIDAQWASLVGSVVGQIGGTLGGLWGSLICGGVVTGVTWGVQKMLKFNDGTAMKLLIENGEEALDELFDNLRAVAYTLKNAALNWFFMRTFKNMRRATKWILHDPTSWQSRVFKKFFGEGAFKWIQKWGEKGEKPWSFAIAKEEEYDAIAKTNKNLARYWEEFDEEFREACQQAFYISANVFEQQAVEPTSLLGAEKAVEIYPDRNDRDNKIIIGGNEAMIKPLIVSTVQNAKLMENKNVGMIIGQTLETKIANLKGVDTKQCDLLIRYHDQKEPPFSRKGKVAIDHLVRVPDVNRAKLDEWQLIKTLAGGKSGYLGGGIKVVAHLGGADGLESDTMEVMAGSEDAGMDLIEDLIKLTDLKVLWYSPITQSKRGTKGHWMYEKPAQVHPAFMTVVNYERIIKEQEGKKPPSGTYKKDKYLIPLWVDTEPQGFKQIITELLMTNG